MTLRVKKQGIGNALEVASQWVTQWTGSSSAFSLAVLVLVVWGITGPIFDFSNTWQLVINTGTTIVTFLMVFLIQRSQNKEGLAIQLKLNEIVAALSTASNRLIDIEDLSEGELRVLKDHFRALAAHAKTEHDLFKSHSIDEAKRRHRRKARARIADEVPPVD
ncbi:MAG: low affinity iron permease family protein [Myxococcaceae bacterium]